MTHKQNILKDILCVIAYGTSTARSSAAKLLFYYWPAFNPNLFDRKGLICKLGGDAAPFVCQRDMCPNAGNAEAAKVCYDHCISITFASDTPPPLYLCIECANEIHREHPNQLFFDNLHPMQQVSMVCENKVFVKLIDYKLLCGHWRSFIVELPIDGQVRYFYLFFNGMCQL